MPGGGDTAQRGLREAFDPAHPDRVEVRETHGAWVFLAGDRAYKVRKPVVLPYLDYGTLERRRALAHEELRLNRDLAPGVYLGVRALVDGPDGLRLAGEEADGAVEYALEMRRLAEDRTLAALLERDALREDDVRAVARRVAAFHASTPAAPHPERAAERERQAIAESLDELRAAAPDAAARRRVDADRRFAEAFLHARGRWLQRRAASGRVRDCHGDLRAEHVVLEDAIRIFDRLEFDPELRYTDVAADVAFLAMDLKARGGARFVPVLRAAYRDAEGDAGDDAFVAFLGAARAWVRAKVGLLQGTSPAAYLELAEHLCWRARGPLVLAVGGLSASGKTTVAAAVAKASGFEHLSSDVVRKRGAGLAPQDRGPASLYDDAVSREVYRRLGEAAAGALRRDGGAVVDATFRRPADREAFLEGLGPAAGALVWVDCTAPPDVLVRRAEERAGDPGRVSDASAEVVRAQLRGPAGGSEDRPGRQVGLDTDAPLETTLGGLRAALDAMLVAPR